MTTISPNYVGVNFRATGQLQSPKAEVNPKKEENTKSMSNTMKAGIGLGALAVAIVAGLSIKSKIATKKRDNDIAECINEMLRNKYS